MMWLWLPLASFTAMYCQDVLGVVMVRAETAGRAHRAAACDTAQDACRIAGLLVNAGTVLLGHDIPLSVAVVGATLAADYIGTFSGVLLGAWLDRRAP